MAGKFDEARKRIVRNLVRRKLLAMSADELDHLVRLHIVRCEKCTPDTACQVAATLTRYAVQKRHLKVNGARIVHQVPPKKEE